MLDEILDGISRIKKWDWVEWAVLSIVMFFISCYLLYLYFGSVYYGAELPGYVFALVIGFFVGGTAYVVDSLMHKALKKKIPRLEHIVHYFILFGATVPLWASMILAYWFGMTMLPFSMVFALLQVYYVLYDETIFHWKRGYVPEQIVHWLIIWGPGSAEIAMFYWAYVDNYVGLNQVIHLLGL